MERGGLQRGTKANSDRTATKRPRAVTIIGVPMDLGANRRGVDMGPSAIRVTQVTSAILGLGIDAVDIGDIDVPIPEEVPPGDSRMKYGREIQRVCDALREAVRKVMVDERMPIVLGGDHSIAMGSIAGVSDHYAAKGEKIGLIYVDAHGDMNTPSSTSSGNVHGMPLSHILGMWDTEDPASKNFGKVSSEHSCLVGVRDLDEQEKRLIKDSRIHVFTMKEIDRYGMAKVMEEVIHVTTDGTAGVHLSFDADALDPSIAPGVGTPKRGGINYREAHFLMELLADSKKLIGLDFVEVNPILDLRNLTAELASELILSALGKSIF
jgi:arginase